MESRHAGRSAVVVIISSQLGLSPSCVTRRLGRPCPSLPGHSHLPRVVIGRGIEPTGVTIRSATTSNFVQTLPLRFCESELNRT